MQVHSKRPGTRSEMPDGVKSEADKSQSWQRLSWEPVASILSGYTAARGPAGSVMATLEMHAGVPLCCHTVQLLLYRVGSLAGALGG